MHEVLGGVTVSNGLGWAPDGTTAYYIDSPTQRVDAFVFDTAAGRFGERKTIVEIPADTGMPDGLTVDSGGGIWAALWGGAAVHRYTPEGILDEVVELPVSCPTSCVFGGERLDELFITTSALALAEGAEPSAGAVFHVCPGIDGLPTERFAG